MRRRRQTRCGRCRSRRDLRRAALPPTLSVLPAKRGLLRPHADRGVRCGTARVCWATAAILNRCSTAFTTRAFRRSPRKQMPVDWSQTYAADQTAARLAAVDHGNPQRSLGDCHERCPRLATARSAPSNCLAQHIRDTFARAGFAASDSDLQPSASACNGHRSVDALGRRSSPPCSASSARRRPLSLPSWSRSSPRSSRFCSASLTTSVRERHDTERRPMPSTHRCSSGRSEAAAAAETSSIRSLSRLRRGRRNEQIARRRLSS